MGAKIARVEENGERARLKKWNWGATDEQLQGLFDAAATHGASIMLDEILANARLYIWVEGGVKWEANVHLFGDFSITFDIEDEIKSITEDDLKFTERKRWEEELVEREKVAAIFRSMAEKVEREVLVQRERGTLNDAMGMSYATWSETKPELNDDCF